MQIKIPRRMVSAWTAFEDWANVALYVRGRFELRIADVLLAAGFLLCVVWYAATVGWQGALAGAIMYIVLAALAAMVRP